MGIFSRKRNTPGANSTASSGQVGRRLSSSLNVEDCERMFRGLCADLAGYPSFSTPRWSGANQEQPDLLLAAGAHSGPALYLGVWDRGDHREVNLVPVSRPDQLPPAMIGSWKMQDSSLSSTGTVTSFSVS